MDNQPESITTTWRQKYNLFDLARLHPFITGIRNGIVGTQDFNRGLAHDYLLTGSLVQFAQTLYPKCDGDIYERIFIAREIAVFEREHEFIRDRWNELQIGLPNNFVAQGGRPEEGTEEFDGFLEYMRGGNVEYNRGLTVLWAIESAIVESFASCLNWGATEEMQELVARWGDVAACQKCATLQEYVDGRLDGFADADLLEVYEDDVMTVDHVVSHYWKTRLSLCQDQDDD